jgi:hypothetical protein
MSTGLFTADEADALLRISLNALFQSSLVLLV